MQVVMTVILIVLGALCLALADGVAILVGSKTGADEWIVNISELVVSAALGVVAGRLLGKRWYISAAIPLLYFGYLAWIMHNANLLWIGLNMPLALLTIVTAAFVSAATKPI